MSGIDDLKAFLWRHPELSWKTVATLYRVGETTRNGHVYPRELWVQEISRFQVDRPIFKGSLFKGLTDQMIAAGTNLRIDGDAVKLDVKFLFKDSKLQAYLKNGGKLVFGPVGTGRCGPDGVVSDYKFSGFSVEAETGI